MGGPIPSILVCHDLIKCHGKPVGLSLAHTNEVTKGPDQSSTLGVIEAVFLGAPQIKLHRGVKWFGGSQPSSAGVSILPVYVLPAE